MDEINREIQIRFGKYDPLPSISAQLRHLRKDRFGSHVIDRKYIGDGLYKYRMEPDSVSFPYADRPEEVKYTWKQKFRMAKVAVSESGQLSLLNEIKKIEEL